MWRKLKISFGERFQPFIIIRQDEKKATSKFRNRNLKHQKGARGKNEKKNKQESGKNTHTKEHADFRRFSARGGAIPFRTPIPFWGQITWN